MLLCRDCAHCLEQDERPALCERVTYVEPVMGETRMEFCANARQTFGACGPDAVLFEPADSEGKIPTSGLVGA